MVGGSRRSVVVDCRLYDADGAVVAELSRLRLTSLALGRSGMAKAELLASHIEPLAPLVETPPPAEPLRSARAAVRETGEDAGLAALQGRLDAIAAGAAVDALIALRDDPVPNARQARLARLIGVIEGCAEPALDWQPAWRAALHAHPELLAELTLLGRGGRALLADLRAEGPRPVPGAATTQHLYESGPMFAETRRRAARALADFAAAWPADRRLRVLIAAPPALAVDLAGAPAGRTLRDHPDGGGGVGGRPRRPGRPQRRSRPRVRPRRRRRPSGCGFRSHRGDPRTGGSRWCDRGAQRPGPMRPPEAQRCCSPETAPSAWAEIALGCAVGPALRDLEGALDAAGWRIEAKRRDGAGLLFCAAAPSALQQEAVASEDLALGHRLRRRGKPVRRRSAAGDGAARRPGLPPRAGG